MIDGRRVESVRLETDALGRIASVTPGVPPEPHDTRLGFAAPGFVNAHSHLFHRLLRGRTHDRGGDFWQWRELMYDAAGRLNPEHYRALALAVFAEMLEAGYTAVGEFHYLHHRPDGTPYTDPEHAMELAIASAAVEVGIRLTLLDTVYLTSGLGPNATLTGGQRRFSDGSARGWLHRWQRLRVAIDELGDPRVSLGAAIHSVRAVPEAEIRLIVDELPREVPLHVHLSEQRQENRDCLQQTGLTPTGLLARAGAVSARLTAVHATHVTEGDIRILGEAGAGVVMCPSTEADLGDGIGPASALADAGAVVAIGSDQNAVVDPLLELRGLEAAERLAHEARGQFSPEQLWRIGSVNGSRQLGVGPGGIRVGAWCDLVELDLASSRTFGSAPEQVVLSATASDVVSVVVGGVRKQPVDVAAALGRAFAGLDRTTHAPAPYHG